jgi:hypothetical protein
MEKILTTTFNNINITLDTFNIVRDFDNDIKLIIFNENKNNDLECLGLSKGVKMYGNTRFDKLQQFFILERLGINTPKCFYNIHTNRIINSIDEFNAFVNLDEFVVKPLNGARGIGVKIITRDQWKDCIMDQKNTYKVFYDEFTIDNKNIVNPEVINDNMVHQLRHKSDDINKDYIEYGFKNFLIQEPINVKREFRLVYFRNGEFMVYERLKKEGEFCGTLSHGSTSGYVCDELSKRYITPLFSNLNKVLDITNYPWMSVDIYVDTDDNVGIFEFQMEFGYDGFQYQEVKEKMTECLNFLIEKPQNALVD